MKKYFRKIERQFKFQCKIFDFWIGVAKMANRNAGAANMKCKLLSDEMIRVSQGILDESEEASNMSRVES